MFITNYTVKRECIYFQVRNYSMPTKLYRLSYRFLLAQFSSVHLYTKYFLTSTLRYRSHTLNLRDNQRRRQFRAHRYNIKLFRLSLKSSFRFLVLRFLKRSLSEDKVYYWASNQPPFKKPTKSLFSLEFFCSNKVFLFMGGSNLTTLPSDSLFSAIKPLPSWRKVALFVSPALLIARTPLKWRYLFLHTLTFHRYYHYQLHITYFDSNGLAVDERLLVLNFRDFRFFPSIQTTNRHVYTTVSLGMFSKYLNKGKSFIKNKIVYLIISGFFRKLLVYSDLRRLILIVKRTPLYFKDILSSIHNPVITKYKHPFSGVSVDEKRLDVQFFFSMFIFVNSKSYSFLKTRKKGRIKRKITKRLVKINSIID